VSILSWLKNFRKPRGEQLTGEDIEKQQDAQKADIGGTLLVRGSAKSEAERLSPDD
jgi:hypothetical protein